jgi:hypothetical protein
MQALSCLEASCLSLFSAHKSESLQMLKYSEWFSTCYIIFCDVQVCVPLNPKLLQESYGKDDFNPGDRESLP